MTTEEIGWKKFEEISSGGTRIVLSDEVIKKISECRTYLDRRLEKEGEIIYGINTGFGSLCDKVISSENLGLLQKNLVMSLACGVGDEVPKEITRLMLLLKSSPPLWKIPCCHIAPLEILYSEPFFSKILAFHC